MTTQAELIQTLSRPQLRFCATESKYPGFVGGLGSGKTHAGITRAVTKKLQYPNQNVAYYLPTYDLVKKIGYPRFEEYLTTLGIPYTLNTSDHVFKLNGGQWGEIIFRTMDSPARIIGYEVADSVADELDTLPIDKARDVWQKMMARNRQKKPDGALNTIGVVTTPEGFRFTYEQWQEQAAKNAPKGYELIHAPTSANRKNLPEDYISDLMGTYPENLIRAYLNGEFVNLTSGSVYPSFDRRRNASNEVMKPKEALHIGIDFNVTKMAAIIHVLRGNDVPHAVDELIDVFDTRAIVKIIKERFKNNGHPIFVYPDATGNARDSSGASESDIKLLRDEFTVCVNKTNPMVRDRVIAMNVKFLHESKPEYFINVAKCPHYVQGLEKQCYDKNGEPEKSTGVDHCIDAGGYFITYRYPIVRRVISTSQFSR